MQRYVTSFVYGLHVLPVMTIPKTPVETPPFKFSLFVPALPDPGNGWLKCWSKGHLEPRYYGKRVVWTDSDEIYAWVNHIVSVATNKRMQLQRQGQLFPCRRAVQASALFVFNRPHTQQQGPPVTVGSDYGVGDVDGLQKAVGDALVAQSKNAKYPKAGIIEDDRLIVRWLEAEKAFVDMIDWEDQKPAPGVWFKIEEYDDAPIKISRYL